MDQYPPRPPGRQVLRQSGAAFDPLGSFLSNYTIFPHDSPCIAETEGDYSDLIRAIEADPPPGHIAFSLGTVPLSPFPLNVRIQGQLEASSC
jgi:hypothetical protein